MRVRADGKDRVLLEAQLSHSLQGEDRAMGLRLDLSQSLLPTPTDLRLDMAANVSSHRCRVATVHYTAMTWFISMSPICFEI